MRMNIADKARMAVAGWALRGLGLGGLDMLPFGNWTRDGGNSKGAIRSWRYNQFADEGYCLNWIVAACLLKIMGGCTAIGFQLSNGGEKVEETDLSPELEPLRRLLRRPNPNQSAQEFIQQWVLHLYLGGISFAEKSETGVERIGNRVRGLGAPELWLLRPNNVEVKVNGREITGYELLDSHRKLDPEQVIFWRHPHPHHDIAGMSPLQPAAFQIDGANKAQEWNNALYDNKAVPASAVLLKGLLTLGEAEQQRHIRTFEKKFAGVKNAGKTYIGPAEGGEFLRLGSTPQELDWNNSNREIMRRVCAVLGVPSKLLNDPEAGTYANYNEARSAFAHETVLPLMDYFVAELNHRLAPDYGPDVQIELDTSKLDALLEDKLSKRKSLAMATWLTDDERRAEDGKYPAIGGDAAKLRPNQSSVTINEAQGRNGGEKGEVRDFLPERREKALAYVAAGSLYQTEEARRKAGDDFDKKLGGWDGRWRGAVADYFDWQLTEVLKKDWADNPPARTLEQIGSLDQFIARFETLSLELTVDFGKNALEELKAQGIEFNIERPGLKGKIAADIADRSKLIDRTTADKISSLLEQAEFEGVGFGEKSLRLREMFGDMSKGRADAIARTEVHRAAQQATLEGYKQSGRVKHKEWLSARDDKVRDSHQKIDGMVVDIDADFNVGGARMQAPGLSGNPGEDINCRCRVAPIKDPEDAI